MWRITGAIDHIGEMDDGSLLYVTFASKFVDGHWEWVQVYYPQSKLNELAALAEGDQYSTECFIAGRRSVTQDSDDYRVECVHPDVFK